MVITMEFSEILEGLSYNEKKLLLALDEKGGRTRIADLISDGTFSLEV